MRNTVLAALGMTALVWGALGQTGENPGATPHAAAVRLVCIGDSITQGRKGGGETKPTFSYRYPLWKLLVDAGASVDFVGSLKVGFNGDPDWADYKGKPFDRDHEGHWGWTTRNMREKLPEWIQGYAPDMALILLGTNDRNKKVNMSVDDTKDEMQKIVEILRQKNPKVVVIIGQCYQEWEPFPALRAKMDELAKAISTEASPVVTVDHSQGWISKPDKAGTHTVDWVHPNESGDAKLAQNWFQAMKPFLEKAKALPAAP